MSSWPFDPLPMFGFDVVMCDPPWPFELRSEKGEEKSPQAQYSTMSMGDIEAMPIGNLVADGGLIFLWCTWPLIDRQAAIMRQWGFVPKTGGAWNKRTPEGKLRWGTGYVLRSVCEPFLIGGLSGRAARGPKLINMVETLAEAVVDGVAREHSRKPDEAYSLLEHLSPGARRADIFSRQSRPGWSGWGDQAVKFDGAAS